MAGQVWEPQPGPQTEFFKRQEFEVLYGGAAGGGKTIALLMEAGRQSQHPEYRAYFFRRTYPELEEAIDKAKQMYLPGGWMWKEREFTLIAPSGARIRFRHMEHEDDWRKYQGHGIHYAAFDELTQFTKVQYDKIKAWVRSATPGIRAYVRCSSNPKGIGHSWVKARFVDHGAYQRVAEEIRDPKTGRTFTLDRVFIPASVYDNKILLDNDPAYLARLLTMPEVDRKAYLEGLWEGGEGQFFAEWSGKIHVTTPVEIPAHWRRFGMLDYGFATPFCYLQGAMTPDGGLIVYRELYASKVRDTEQATRIAAACEKDRPEYIVAGKDLWHKSGKGIHGHSTAETYQAEWKRLGFSTRLLMGDSDRVQGWRRMRMFLQPFPGADGTPTALGRVVGAACPNLVRTLPDLQFNPDDPDDVLQVGAGYVGDGGSMGEDHAPEALRLGVMSRPQPRVPTMPQPGPYDIATIAKQWFRDKKKHMRIGEELSQGVGQR